MEKVMDKTEGDQTNDKMSEKSLETNTEEKDEECVSNGIAKTADTTVEEKEPMDVSEESGDNKSPKDDKSTKTSPAQSSGAKKRSSRSRSSRSSRSSSVDKPAEKIKEETVEVKEEEEEKEEKEQKEQKEKEAEFVKPKDESMSVGDFPGFESSPVPDLKKEQYIKLLRVSLGRDHDDESMSQGANSDHMSIDNPPSVDSDNFTMSEGAPRRSTRAKKSLNVDMSNPEFRKPFDFGWTRELVYRSMHEGERTRRNADVYYYNSSGKKFRSYRDLHDYLSDGLEEKNFTFFKEPIGINDPTKEIIRGAKAKPPAKVPTEENAQKKPATPKLKPKPAPKSETPKTMPKVVFYKNNSNKNKNMSNKANLYKKRKSAGPDDFDAMSDTDWSPEQKHPTLDVCSIECRRAMGLIPNLQCSKCLCLYHKECMVVAQDKISKTNYICKNCQISKPTNSSVTPPSTSSSPTKPAPKVTSPVKKEFKMISRTQPIVGALTTWLPPSSSIQVANSQNTKTNTVVSSSATATTPSAATSTSPSKPVSPQGLVSMNGTSYILIQKHNVVNVSDQNTVAHQNADSVPTSPVVSQPQIGKTPLFLVPYQVPPPDSLGDSAQFPVGNSSVQAVPVLPTGSSQNGVKRPSDGDLSPPPEKKFKQIAMRNTSTELKENFMMNLNAGFTALLHAFQYLKVHELLRAVCVSQMWRHIASHRSLWETVRMKNSRVRDWDGFGQALRYHCTKNLDLRKMLLPETQEQTNQMWEEFGAAVAGLTHLKRIDFGRCTSQAIEIVAESNPQLESIVTLSLRSSEIDFKSIGNCVNLVELKLKSASGIEIKDLSALKNLKQLKVLALTTVKNLEGIEDALSESIENLELGDCTKFTQYFATDALPKLKNLKRLRLEKGQGTCPTIPILDAISDLPNLTQLELINFDIKPGFDTSLARCSNLKTLLIIPTYVTQSATTNHVVMGGVSKLSQSLTYFIWGLTLELLRVTELFIDQVEGSKSKVANSSPGMKKASGDSIPILKPMTDVNEAKEGQSASQVDILGLPKLQRVLSTILPTTKIKILKVPFSATWRQTVTDSSAQ